MDYIVIALQLLVGISILNVWLIQYKKPTKWRGGEAKTIIEEFHVYGLPTWFCYVIGAAKVLLAIGLLASIQYPVIMVPSAIGLGALLAGSVIMHIKIKDPFYKSIPALSFLIACILIAVSPYFMG